MNIKFTSLLIICYSIVWVPSFADHITAQGTVSGEWNTDTVFVTGDLFVSDGQALTIHPGVNVIFTGMYQFLVDGSLTAMGLMTDSVYFMMADTTGFSVDTIPDGGWRGIRFNRNRVDNDSSLFLFCHFAFGKMVSEDQDTGHGGAVYVNDFGKVRIGRSLFRNNFSSFHGGAVYLDSANIIIHDCVFAHNRCGLLVFPWGYGGAVCSDNSSPEVRGNVFTHNSSTGIGGGLAVRYIDCNVYSNVFIGNSSALGGGLGFLHMPEVNRRINNNLIAENTAQFFGGGVANVNAGPIYINNTIVNNSATYGGGFYCKDSISPDFFNTIIWGNNAAVGPQGYLFEVYSQADFFNCDVEDGPELFGGSGGGEAFYGTYEDCIDEFPDFEGSGYHPYGLISGSPCIDAGSTDTTGFLLPATDLAGNPRISNGITDIGAYEFMVTGVEAWERGSREAWERGSLEIWPNPTTGEFKVQSSKFKDEFTVEKIEIVDLNGKVMNSWNSETWNSETLKLNISQLPDGIYFIRAYNKGSLALCKIIKVSR